MRNSIVAVSIQIVSLLVGFFSRRIFLNVLGTEILGLNTTAQSLLGFLNLAELGIGGAVAVTLYKPIFEGDENSVREIVSLQGWMYRIVALVVMALSAVAMIFFPHIFAKSELPVIYAYASFGVFLYGSLLGYFFNYKQVLLDAYQLNYKIQLSLKLVNILKLASQALALVFFEKGYLWWLILEFVFPTIAAVILAKTVNRTFPFIKEKVPDPARLRKEYPDVVLKIKQILFHKLSAFVNNQSTPLLIYAFASLTAVAKYGNYLILTANLTAIFTSAFSGITASLGNMVVEGDKKLGVKVFRELFSFRFYMTAVACVCLWYLADPFISVWLGEEYLMERSTLALMIALFYITSTYSVIESYLAAHGLYRDIWSPVVQAALSIGLAVLLGKFYGLNGVLAGFVISQLLIFKGWKPFFLFRDALKEPFSGYVFLLLKHLAIGALSFFAVRRIVDFIHIDASASFLCFFEYAFIIFGICSVLMLGLLLLTESGMRGFLKRLIIFVKK